MKSIRFISLFPIAFSLLLASCSDDDRIGPGSPADSGWVNTYGTLERDEVKAVAVIDNGDIIVTGNVVTESHKSDIFVLKLDKSGRQLWLSRIDESEFDLAGDIFPIDTGMLIIGTGNSSGSSARQLIWIVMDREGKSVSRKILPQPNSIAGSVMAEAIGGDEYVILGNSTTSPYWGASNATFVMKVNLEGNAQWLKYFAGSACHHPDFDAEGSGSGRALAVDQLSGATTFAWFCLSWTGMGINDCGPPEEHMYVQQLDSDGNVNWQSHADFTCDILAIAEGGSRGVVGIEHCYDDGPRFMAYSLEGENTHEQKLEIAPNAALASIAAGSAGNLIVGAVPSRGSFYAYLDVNGNLLRELTLEDGASAVMAAEAPDGSWIIAGNKPSTDSSMQAYVMKIDPQ